jgi:hypothetical protein
MATVSETSGVRPDYNALGKAAFIVGLISLVMSFIPIIGFVSWLLAPLSILFGIIALFRPSRSMAIAGIVCGVIALFVCVSWVKGVQSVGKAMSADTFNNQGNVMDNAAAPIMSASIKGLWNDLEANKIAAGKKYGGHRLAFHDEKISDFSGKADSPTLSFVGKNDGYISQLVSVAFSATDGDKIGALKKGQKVSFVCEDIGESFGDGYSLSKCSLS